MLGCFHSLIGLNICVPSVPSEIEELAIYYGSAGTNSCILLLTPTTRKIAVNGSTVTSTNYTAHAEARSGYLKANTAGTYFKLFIYPFDNYSWQEVQYSAGDTIVSYSSLANALCIVYKK